MLKAAGRRRGGRELCRAGRDVGAAVVAAADGGDQGVGAGTKDVTLPSAFPQPGGFSITRHATATSVYVGHGTDADLAGRDLKGRIAVVRVRTRTVAVPARRARASRRGLVERRAA